MLFLFGLVQAVLQLQHPVCSFPHQSDLNVIVDNINETDHRGSLGTVFPAVNIWKWIKAHALDQKVSSSLLRCVLDFSDAMDVGPELQS